MGKRWSSDSDKPWVLALLLPQPYVNYKLALTMGACHLPLQGLNHVLLQLLTFSTP